MKKLLFLLTILFFSCNNPEEPKDCAGVSGGSAEIDECGICTGGNTELIANYLQDCLGECGGYAVVNCLGICNGDVVVEDCAGVCNGDAIIDDCGICTGGNTELIANYLQDCSGECGGNSIIDCLGECNGDAIIDCNGNCGGLAEIDECGLCTGGETGLLVNYLQDCSGECGGDAIEDCAGSCNGEAYLDDCEVCSGGLSNHLPNSDMDDCGVCGGTDNNSNNICEQPAGYLDNFFGYTETDELGNELGNIDNNEGCFLEDNSFNLFVPYPNPSSSNFSINCSISNSSFMILRIINEFGDEIKSLLSGNLPVGTYTIDWNGTDNNNNIVENGLYRVILFTSNGYCYRDIEKI